MKHTFWVDIHFSKVSNPEVFWPDENHFQTCRLPPGEGGWVDESQPGAGEGCWGSRQIRSLALPRAHHVTLAGHSPSVLVAQMSNRNINVQGLEQAMREGLASQAAAGTERKP